MQKLARSGWNIHSCGSRNNGDFARIRRVLAFDLGVSIQDDIAEIGQKSRGSIAAGAKAKKLRRIVQKRCGDLAGAKFRMIDDIFHEGDVGFDTADAELSQSSIHALASFGQICSPRRHLDQ